MGAWGHGNFENDDALDLLNEVRDDGYPVLSEALRAVNDGGDLDAPECSRALAAGEVVACASDRPGEGIDAEDRDVASAIRVADVDRQAASEAAGRVLADSELRALWEETQYYSQWADVVEDLRRRLDGPAASHAATRRV